MTPKTSYWKDCPNPIHNCMNYDTDLKWMKDKGHKPCKTCLAHFRAVDKARAEAIEECAKIAIWKSEIIDGMLGKARAEAIEECAKVAWNTLIFNAHSPHWPDVVANAIRSLSPSPAGNEHIKQYPMAETRPHKGVIESATLAKDTCVNCGHDKDWHKDGEGECLECAGSNMGCRLFDSAPAKSAIEPTAEMMEQVKESTQAIKDGSMIDFDESAPAKEEVKSCGICAGVVPGCSEKIFPDCGNQKKDASQ